MATPAEIVAAIDQAMAEGQLEVSWTEGSCSVTYAGVDSMLRQREYYAKLANAGKNVGVARIAASGSRIARRRRGGRGRLR